MQRSSGVGIKYQCYSILRFLECGLMSDAMCTKMIRIITELAQKPGNLLTVRTIVMIRNIGAFLHECYGKTRVSTNKKPKQGISLSSQLRIVHPLFILQILEGMQHWFQLDPDMRSKILRQNGLGDETYHDMSKNNDDNKKIQFDHIDKIGTQYVAKYVPWFGPVDDLHYESSCDMILFEQLLCVYALYVKFLSGRLFLQNAKQSNEPFLIQGGILERPKVNLSPQEYKKYLHQIQLPTEIPVHLDKQSGLRFDLTWNFRELDENAHYMLPFALKECINFEKESTALMLDEVVTLPLLRTPHFFTKHITINGVGDNQKLDDEYMNTYKLDELFYNRIEPLLRPKKQPTVLSAPDNETDHENHVPLGSSNAADCTSDKTCHVIHSLIDPLQNITDYDSQVTTFVNSIKSIKETEFRLLLTILEELLDSKNGSKEEIPCNQSEDDANDNDSSSDYEQCSNTSTNSHTIATTGKEKQLEPSNPKHTKSTKPPSRRSKRVKKQSTPTASKKKK